MRLQTQKQKNVIKLAKIAVIVLAIALIITAVVLIVKNISDRKAEEAYNQEVRGISMNSYPVKLLYYVGDEFDPTGIRIQVLTNGQEYTSFVSDIRKMSFSGFDSSVPCEKLTITVTYEGWTTTFDVEIKEEPKPAPTVVDIELYGFKSTYSLEYWNEYGPSFSNAYLILVYSDDTRSDKIWIKGEWATQRKILSAPGKAYITVEYLGIKKDVEFTIT